MTARARSRPALLLAIGLGLFSVAAAWRAMDQAAQARVHLGVFTPASGSRAREAVAVLARGLLAHQRSDGAIEAGPGWAFGYEVERVANTALAAAALADAQALQLQGQVPGLEDGLRKALLFLADRQAQTGPIGERHPKDVWSQVEATGAAILAAGTTDLPEAVALLEKAGPALARMAQGGIKNGWTRALCLLAVDRLLERKRQTALGRPFRDLLDRRDVNESTGADGLLRATDWNLTEAISRTLLEIRRGADAFPARMVDSVLADLPVWRGQGSDTKTWWLEAWIAARSGRGEPWFEALLKTFEHDVLLEEGLLPSSFYTCATAQTAALLLALAEGLRA